ncbi:unnamed protein product [Clavelina lepadiformis]|uniref:Uncharacterized protein n=1 Tax=Clavelina lepadiformis TaxID=159417 RepID=A0ABP0FLJ2_CLALP
MTEKIRDGISRELRYMEYRLRKRRSERDKKKSKNDNTKNYPTMADQDENFSPELKEALPSTAGEEDLQLQVALAMSREEAAENEKSEMSDKIKLEMALKESAEVAAKATAKVTPSHSSSSTNNQKSDPWGGPAPQNTQNSFDLFETSDPPKSLVTNGFESNAWGSASATANANNSIQKQTADPWGNQNSAGMPGILPPPAKSITKKVNPWGTSQPGQSNSDPWGTGPSSASNDFGTTASDPWSSSTPAVNNMVNPVSSQNDVTFNAFMQQNGTTTTPNNASDPFPNFSQMSIQPQPTPAAYSGQDWLASNVLTPHSINEPQPTISDFNDNSINDAMTKEKAGSFLGENASLVNIDSLVTKPPTTHPYITMNTPTSGSIGANRNPFNQKGPSPSLNQLKGNNQSAFAGQPAPQLQSVAGTTGAFQVGMQPNPMVANMAMGGMAMQPSYGMPPMAANVNPFGTPQMTQANMFPSQQNQSLF